MQPENTNPIPNPGSPQQPGQAPFRRRPIQQPIAPRPFASPSQAPQQAQPQPQQFRPQPIQQPAPVAPQTPKPPADNFAPPAQATRPVQPAAPQFRAPAQPVAPPAQPDFGASRRPVSLPSKQAQPDDIEAVPAGFKMSLDFQQTKQQKTKLPKGVLALVVFGIAGLVIGLFDKSQHSMVFNVVLGLDLLLAIALFVRKEFIHKAALGMAVATVIASAALALSYRGLTDSTVKAEALFIAEAKKLQNQSPTKQLTHEQQQHLDAMQLQLEAQQQAVGKNSSLVYGKYGGTLAVYALAILYLTRPQIKEALIKVKKDS